MDVGGVDVCVDAPVGCRVLEFCDNGFDFVCEFGVAFADGGGEVSALGDVAGDAGEDDVVEVVAAALGGRDGVFDD